jgi:hypothetical protein
MHQYRQALVRMRHGDSDRELARSRYMRRHRLAALRTLAEQHGWLAALGPPQKAIHLSLWKAGAVSR